MHFTRNSKRHAGLPFPSDFLIILLGSFPLEGVQNLKSAEPPVDYSSLQPANRNLPEEILFLYCKKGFSRLARSVVKSMDARTFSSWVRSSQLISVVLRSRVISSILSEFEVVTAASWATESARIWSILATYGRSRRQFHRIFCPLDFLMGD